MTFRQISLLPIPPIPTRTNLFCSDPWQLVNAFLILLTSALRPIKRPVADLGIFQKTGTESGQRNSSALLAASLPGRRWLVLLITERLEVSSGNSAADVPCVIISKGFEL